MTLRLKLFFQAPVIKDAKKRMKLITCTQGRKISHYTTVWWELALLQFHGVDEV